MLWLFYLKTTETCNLNCKHCFTNGTNGAKIFWNTDKIVDWVHRFRKEYPDEDDGIHFEFHGGEPFLVPPQQMRDVYNQCKDLWGTRGSWGATSNLVFKMYNEHIDLIRDCFGGRLGTSYDPKIRFANDKQYNLWRKNVKRLLDEGFTVKLNISVTQDVIDMEPIDLLRWVKELGVQEVAFERLTWNGSANAHPEIFPSNIDKDLWFLKMHQQSEEHGARKWFDNEFLENIYAKFEHGMTKCGTFCRDCEEKIFTINADGSISGCPNAAPEFSYGTVDDEVTLVTHNPKRINTIVDERCGNTECHSCPVFQYCGGDCHQLQWEDGVCGAPKSMMMELAGINTVSHIPTIIPIYEIREA